MPAFCLSSFVMWYVWILYMTSSACVGGSYRGRKLPEGGVKTWGSQVVR